MVYRRKIPSFLMLCLLLGLSLGTAIASAADTTAGEENNYTVSVSKDNTISSVPVIYVATDGSGDYNCDGTADQVEINEALQYAKNNNFDTVYLKSGTYTIDDSIRIPDGMTLTGDSDATVRLIADWSVTRSDMFTPMITHVRFCESPRGKVPRATRLVVMCRKDVEEPLKMVRHVLERLGLSLNETKTHIVDATQTGFNFLGFTIQMSQGMKTGKQYPSVRPADKSLKKIKARLKELTGRNLTPIPLENIVGNVNRSLRGWVNYFHYRNSSEVMGKVKTHTEDRLRTHMMKRHKVKDRGTGLRRFPSRDLYDCYGLYKVPTVAGWRIAHALV